MWRESDKQSDEHSEERLMMLRELWKIKKVGKIDNREGTINSNIIFYYSLRVVNSKRIGNYEKKFLASNLRIVQIIKCHIDVFKLGYT